MTFTIAKITALLVVILTALWTVYEKSKDNTNQLIPWLYTDKPYDFSKIALSLYNSLFSYSGWYYHFLAVIQSGNNFFFVASLGIA